MVKVDVKYTKVSNKYTFYMCSMSNEQDIPNL